MSRYKQTDKTFEFNSLRDLVTEAKSVPDTLYLAAMDDRQMLSHGREWAGKDTWRDLCDMCYRGDKSLVGAAEKLLDQISINVETPEREWRTEPVGWFPLVPATIAGHPEDMRRLHHTQSDTNPVTIWTDSTTSAGISSDDMLKRGTAILALVMKLQRVRPVNLIQCSLFSDKLLTVKHDTQPLNLATVTYALTNPGFTRRILYHTLQPQDFGRVNFSEAKMRQRLGHRVKPADLVIPGVMLGDELIKDGVKWVQHQLDRLMKVGD